MDGVSAAPSAPARRQRVLWSTVHFNTHLGRYVMESPSSFHATSPIGETPR